MVIVLDTETTGLDVRHTAVTEPCSLSHIGSEIIQIGGLILDEEMQLQKGFCYFCDCMVAESPARALSVHNIPMESIRAHIPWVFLEDIVEEHLPFLYDEDLKVIGYNVAFDLNMLRQSLAIHKHFRIPSRAITSLKATGRQSVDVMAFLPNRRLSQQAELPELRSKFSKELSSLTVDTNVPALFDREHSSHNAFHDACDTYLLFKHLIWKKKLFRGGNR